MARKGITLIGEPVEHGLIYCSCFFKKLPSPGNVNKKETNGTGAEDDRVLDNDDPRAFYHVGHGAAYLFSVECREYYINSHTGQRMDKFVDRVVHLLSCITGRELGPALISHGAAAYLGYTDLFYYGCWKIGSSKPDPCDPPGENYDFYTFGDSDVEAERRFIEQATIGEAKAASQAKFDEYIAKYTTGEWKNRYIAPTAVRLLRHDKDCQVQLGDSSAKLGSTTPVPEVTTKPASSVIPNSATLNGELDSTGGAACKVWFEWNGKETPKRDKSTPGSFSAKITDLAPETSYTFRACASNPGGTVKGDEIEFTTPKSGWSPLHWMIDTVETTRPEIPVEPVEKFVSNTAIKIKETIPELRAPGSPPPPPPEPLGRE